MKRLAKLLAFFTTLVLAGCVDNADSVSREFRNCNNEVIDALMMVTNEDTAKRMTRRIFKPSLDRYKNSETKLDLMVKGRTAKEFAKDMLESDGVHMYITEVEVNRMRFSLEMTRLRDLLDKYEKQEREALIAEGNNNPQFELRSIAPFLFDLVHKEDTLSGIRKELKEPPIIKYIVQFPTWKIEGFREMADKFRERHEIFKLKQPVRL